MSDHAKKYKTYKDYYKNDDFREKQRKYLSEKIECECGSLCTRSNMAAHKKTERHEKRLEKLEKIPELEIQIQKIENRIKKLEKEKETIEKRIVKIKR